MEIIQIVVCGLGFGLTWFQPSQFYKNRPWFIGATKTFNGGNARLFGLEIYYFVNNPIVD